MASATPDLDGYLSSRRVSPSFGKYQILLLADGGRGVYNLPTVVTYIKAVRWRIEPANSSSQL